MVDIHSRHSYNHFYIYNCYYRHPLSFLTFTIFTIEFLHNTPKSKLGINITFTTFIVVLTYKTTISITFFTIIITWFTFFIYNYHYHFSITGFTFIAFITIIYIIFFTFHLQLSLLGSFNSL